MPSQRFKGLECFKGLRAGKRQPWTPSKGLRVLRYGFDLGKRRRSLERQNLQTKPSGGKRTCPKHVIFMSKCLEVLTGGRSMPGKC